MDVFANRLKAASKRADSMLCVGLDVDVRRLPSCLSKDPNGVLTFIRAIVDATADLACAFKPNLAFFEAMGPAGWQNLADIQSCIPAGVLTIADAKRGDIGSTAEAYARAAFEVYRFDAITLSPYMGYDSIEPFLRYEGRGAFVICKTSNPGSRDLQDLIVSSPSSRLDGKRPLFMAVAELVASWQPAGHLGLVVGATFPQELAAVRQVAQQLPILVPGLGAQGGDMERAVLAGVNDCGELALFNASRSILYASDGADFAQAARIAARQLRDEINGVLRKRCEA